MKVRPVGRPRGSVDRHGRALPVPSYGYARDLMASEVGVAIRQARERMNVSAEELADRLGVSVLTVHAWERRRSCPSSGNLLRVAMALGVRLSTLVEEVPCRR